MKNGKLHEDKVSENSNKTPNLGNKKPVKNRVVTDVANPKESSDSQQTSRRKRKSRKSEKLTETPINGKSKPTKENSTASTGKLDAFQFMMNSRHKSIGRNSPGKEIDFEESPGSVSPKQNLKGQRSRLERWAEAKGASKRKREYEEIGNCIEQKLEKRGKKLKRMLNIECQSDDEVITSQRKRCAVIYSDSENSNDSTKKHSNATEKITNNMIKNWRFKIKMNMDENRKNCTSDDETANVEVYSERQLRTRTKPKIYQDYVTSESEEEVQLTKNKRKSRVKMAPVFLKSVTKPKLDPEAMEARRQFLLSGIPSSLKKELNKPNCIEENDFDVFPSISHVQQKTDDVSFWDLPKIELDLTNREYIAIHPDIFDRSLLNLKKNLVHNYTAANKVKNCKKIIRLIKSENPNYPVYSIFKSIYNKSGYNVTPKQKKKIEVETKDEENPCVFMQWTDKYRAESADEIIGNRSSVMSLKEWLSAWVNLKDTKSKKRNEDSESEFDSTDGDSRDSTKTCGNTVLLRGPIGCGKTAALYAICNELGFNVLEVNASSKRTGRWLLQQLQEATQSHQVRKKEFRVIEKPKMCVLLVEDIDVVFEQDEGFSAALSQIIATSKRPIVLTTTDDPTPSVLKVVSDVRTIKFAPLSSLLTIWLQIVCLVEGYCVDKLSIYDLLSFNKGDIRRTLLQLQLWVDSGCQLNRNVPKIESRKVESFDVKIDGDDSNLSDLQSDEASETREIDVQYNCLSWEQFDSFSWPHCNDLETIYWNLPNLFAITKTEDPLDPKREKAKLIELDKFYDSLTFVDIVCNRNRYCESLDRRWRSKPKNSLALEENMSSYDDDTKDELTRCLLTGRVKMYREQFETSWVPIEVVAAPQRRWSKQFSCQERLEVALPICETLSRRAAALDYMPNLRNMAKSEAERAANNTKRGNRFYNYLKNLGIKTGDSSYKLAGDVFRDI